MKSAAPVSNSHAVNGDVVRIVLKAEGLAQSDLARRLGVDQRQVSRWIRGESGIPVWVRHVLACDQCYRHFVRAGALRL